jgi:cysteine desulfurase
VTQEMGRIYLDYNAITPLHPHVAQAMRAELEDSYGNPSKCSLGRTSRQQILKDARAQVAALLGCAAERIVFTSGGSEANNLALKGTFLCRRDPPMHIITTQIEHPSILEPCRTPGSPPTIGRVAPMRRISSPFLGCGSCSLQ